MIRPGRVTASWAFACAAAVAVAFPSRESSAAEPAAHPTPVIVDTDLGSDIDDAFALALLLASPEVEVRAITTVGADSEDRAWLVCRFLTQCGRDRISVAAGAAPQPAARCDGQIQYRRHPAAIFNRTLKPVKQPAHELLAATLAAGDKKATILACGPLTNIARLLSEYPQAAGRIERIIVSGGAVAGDAPPVGPAAENLAADRAAAEKVLNSPIPLLIVPASRAATAPASDGSLGKLFVAHRPIVFQIRNLHELWDRPTPPWSAPVAAAALVRPELCRFADATAKIDERGKWTISPAAGGTRYVAAVDAEPFTKWFVERVGQAGEVVTPRPLGNPAPLVERGAFPALVHVAEDYDTDIELRWWMSGKGEARDVVAGGRRACRGVLTQDFDDLQGDTRATYRAVIFNPVPGPPMGPRTRLTFRYKLRGADALRVQLYSLSNGYHRCLSVNEGLARNAWTTATVDMTRMRRPDGSGGPLSADERIDDIQFYVPPDAELLIDDVVLYDAAIEGERRPFPKRIVFTGWFDTGKQGQEWPGTFDIVPHAAPRTWKFARSKLDAGRNQAVIAVGLRGERRLGPRMELTFVSAVKNADRVQVEFRHRGQTIAGGAREFAAVAAEPWRSTSLSFDFPAASDRDVMIDEIRFLAPAAAEISLDDLLLYEPGAVEERR